MSAITATGQTNTLAATILKKFDADRSGSLSADEFTSFLTQLVGGLGSQPAAAAASDAPASTSAAAAASPAATASAAFAAVLNPTPARAKSGNMAGFDERKLNDRAHKTFKYEVGRILQNYANTPEGLAQALPEIQALVPEAKIVGTHGDKIDFGAYVDPKAGKIGIVDVLVGASEGGKAWAWQPVE